VNLLKNKRKQSKEKETKKPAKKAQYSDSDEESEEKPKKPAKKVVTKKAKDSDSESEEPKKPAKKVAKKVADSDSDEESEEVPKRKGSQKNGKAKVAKKVAKDSDDSEEEEVVVTKKNKVQEVEAEAEEEDGHKELFVKNLSWNSTQDTIWEHFGQFGTVMNVKVLTDRMTGKPKGIAFVEFEKRSQAQKAINESGDLDGRTPQCSFSNQKDGNPTPRPTNNFNQGNQGGFSNNNFNGEAFTVFVGNLGFKTNEYTVKNFFSEVGNVVSIRIAKNEEGRAKGFCHVDFDTKEAAEKAVSLAGRDLDGREIRVDMSEPRKPRGEGGFRGRGDGGFRGGRGGGRGGRGGGPPRQSHAPMGSTGTKKKFNDSDDE